MEHLTEKPKPTVEAPKENDPPNTVSNSQSPPQSQAEPQMKSQPPLKAPFPPARSANEKQDVDSFDRRSEYLRTERPIQKSNRRRRRNENRGRNQMMKLQIKNLDYIVTESQLIQMLETVAPVERLTVDRADGGRSAGSATVLALGKHAMSIIKAFQGVPVQFRNMKISIVLTDMGPPRRRSYAGGRDYTSNVTYPSSYQQQYGVYDNYGNDYNNSKPSYKDTFNDGKDDYYSKSDLRDERRDDRDFGRDYRDARDNFYIDRKGDKNDYYNATTYDRNYDNPASNAASGSMYNPETYDPDI